MLQIANPGIRMRKTKRDKDIKQGRILRLIRESLRFSQSQFGRLTGLAPSQISNYEAGWSGIGDGVRQKIALAIGVPDSELMRMLCSEIEDEGMVGFWLELNQVGADDLIHSLRRVVHIKKMVAEGKLSPDVLDHLKRQIQILCELAEKVL